MTIESKELDLSTVIKAAMEKHGSGRDAVIPILAEVNQAFGYIPAAALKMVSQRTHQPEDQVHISEGQLFSIATFYEMFSTKPLGRHVIRFCESAPCHVVGGREVWRTLQDELKLKAGETSPDGKWSLITTSCLGICAVGPVILVDEDIYGNVQPEQIRDILGKYE